MERVIRKFGVWSLEFGVALILLTLPVVAAEPPANVAQNVSFSACTKAFNMPVEKLFYLTVAGVAANKFATHEIQSKNGYVVFVAANKEFLAAVSKVDKTRSLLKITPADNSYHFAPGIVSNIFKYVEINANEELKTLPPR